MGKKYQYKSDKFYYQIIIKEEAVLSNKKKNRKKRGFYIALCGCAVVVALMGYVGNFIKDDEEFPKIRV